MSKFCIDSGNKEEERKYFATIDVKDVSTFAPPPRRVGNIPGARPEDRNKGPSPASARASTRPSSVNVGAAANATPPPLPSRGRVSGLVGTTVETESVSSPNSLRSKAPPVAGKPPALPPRQNSQDAGNTTASEQLGKTMGPRTDSTQLGDLRNSLRKTTSPGNGSLPSLTVQDAKTATGLVQKYQKDPKSLSLSDARAGLSLANKVLPPSSDNSPPSNNGASAGSPGAGDSPGASEPIAAPPGKTDEMGGA